MDQEFFHGQFIRLSFILGVSIIVLSRVLKFAYEDTWATLNCEVAQDVFSEIGIATFGGAITTIFLEKKNHKQ